MRSRRGRWPAAPAAAMLAVIVAALVIAGCGSDGGTVSTPSPAATTTSSTSTATPTATTSSTTTPIATTTSTTATAAATSTTSSTTSASTATSLSAHLASGFRLSSPAFGAGGTIPSDYTCDGTETSLPLTWSGVPPGTKELVLVMRDPDAPGGNFVHWAVAGIDPTTTGFGAGGVSGMVIPGRNSFGTLGYRGPCPPQGSTHHYVISLSALAAPSGLAPGFSPDQLQTSALGIATLIGTYGRH